MKRSIIRLSLIFIFLTQSAFADTFVVSDIRIDGLQRLSARSAFSVLPIDVGDTVDARLIADSIRALFRSGNYQDIKVEREGDVLVYVVSERPSISSIELDGNKSIDSENLLEGLARSGLEEGSVFQRATLERVKLELERQYIAQGRYGASVDTKVTPQPRNRVSLEIDIYEGEVASIKHVNIVGNKVFEDETLQDIFELKETHFWSFFKGDDKYAREKISGDLENLRSFYMDRGYINFAIESTQVSVTPNKEHVYITVNVSEGEKFTIDEVTLAGEIPIPEALMKAMLIVKKDQTFSRQLITYTENLISKRLGNEGYTFAEVNGVPEIDNETKKVKVTFYVDPGKRVYVRRISFNGNEKTADSVMRREMRQMEGAWASGQKIELSKVRLERLGYFKGVSIDMPKVAGSDDQIDLEFSVEEQASGSIGASVGYQDGTGVVFGANVSQRNFLGTGNQVSFAINRTKTRNSYNFSYVNPYFTVDGVSRGFSVFFQETDFSESSSVSNYQTDSFGASMRFGYPINENERLNFAFGFDNTTIFASNQNAVEIKEFIGYEDGRCLVREEVPASVDIEGNDVAAYFQDVPVEPETFDCDTLLSQFHEDAGIQSDAFTNYTITGSWNRSTLNRGLLANRGASQRLALELSLPGSDLEYYKFTYKAQRYFKVTDAWTLRFRTEVGYGDGYGDTERLPFYKHYFAGGFGSVRGYTDRSLGPEDSLFSSRAFGGNLLTEGSIELIFPTPFVKDRRSVRTAFFLDGGNVFDTDRGAEHDFELSELRYSVGVGLTWITGIGPLTFSYAKPINESPDDTTRGFNFSVGQTF